MTAHKYTRREINWLRKNRPHMIAAELAELFNGKFGTDLSGNALKRTCLRHGIRSSSDGRFSAGHTTWNKSMKGIHLSPSTQFRKNNIPANYLPIGSERLSKDGYLEQKIADPNIWTQKHRLVWEQHNGPQPPHTAIIFLDGDRTNIDPENLCLVTRRELLRMNMDRYRQAHPELKPSVLAVSKLESAVFMAQKRKGGQAATHEKTLHAL
jgi:hypothetical protein